MTARATQDKAHHRSRARAADSAAPARTEFRHPLRQSDTCSEAVRLPAIASSSARPANGAHQSVAQEAQGGDRRRPR